MIGQEGRIQFRMAMESRIVKHFSLDLQVFRNVDNREAVRAALLPTKDEANPLPDVLNHITSAELFQRMYDEAL